MPLRMSFRRTFQELVLLKAPQVFLIISQAWDPLPTLSTAFTVRAPSTPRKPLHPPQLQQVSGPVGRSSLAKCKQNWEESWLLTHMGIFKAGLLALCHLRPAWLQSQEKPFRKLFNSTHDKKSNEERCQASRVHL